MRRHLVVLLTMLSTGIAASASAQFAVRAPFPVGPQATRDDVVARLMSFDRNADGLLARAELPERMHDLLGRGDGDNNQVLDATEVRRLAASPTTRTVARGLEPGQYGFGDSFGVDTRLHIEGAIDDLRLSATQRQRAFEIARRFETARQEQAKSELLRTMGEMLTSGSLEDFTVALERPSTLTARVVPTPRGNVDVAGPEALRQALNAVIRLRATGNLARTIDRYGLQPDEQKRALAAIERYNDTTRGTLGDADRQGLLVQLQSVLDDEQLDDLRAALERRPIVKQSVGGVSVNVQPFVVRSDVSIQNLVLTD